jgi:hypothetical protein
VRNGNEHVIQHTLRCKRRFITHATIAKSPTMSLAEDSSFKELGALMNRIRAIESLARHHDDAAKSHTRSAKVAEQQAQQARTEARALRDLYKVPSHPANGLPTVS